jgi:signal peptidase
MRPCGPTSAELAAALVQKSELVSQILLSKRTARIRALGTSMLPAIWPGDILVIEPTPLHQLVPGDVIAVRTLSGVRVHRLVNMSGLDWVMRGDAMPQNDPPISSDHVLGRVSEIQRGQQVMIPSRRLRILQRVCSWMLCYSLLCRVVLRLRSIHISHVQRDEALHLRPQKLVS